ncbi:MAG TPA: protocatechuate 3,4-dioxygenase subunit alpha [Vicinamibacteria bacterium]|nr:protocatechuate 3,4-dioxygenase subunit alpha [Vicinamibacteria bacterium]
MGALGLTPSQTVGPFFSCGLAARDTVELAPAGASGERVTVEGRVLDGDGQGVPDALLELWQANTHGRYAHPEDTQDRPLDAAFRGFGRVPTDGDGRFRFATVKPGPVPGPTGAVQAPHVVVSVFARGLQRRLVTRLYFPGDDHSTDYVLGLVPPERRPTLVARQGGGQGTLSWDVVLQGPGETVFLDC